MKINYLKEWGKDGTVYKQTITIDKNMMNKFNNYLVEFKNIVQNFKKDYTSEEIKIVSNLKPLHEGNNYITLTTLNFFKKFYSERIYEPPKKDKNYERILHRNTIINVETEG